MKCYTLTRGKRKILDYVDVSDLHTAHLFDKPKKVKTAAFNTTIPELNWEGVVQSIMQKSVLDVFMYTCVDLIPGDSKSSVITEDCCLVAHDVFDFSPTPCDKSMPLTSNGLMIYRLCYKDHMSIKDNKDGTLFGNVDGAVVEIQEKDVDTNPTPINPYGIELSF